MRGKFIVVFAVFATVVRSSCAADITSYYDLSADQSTDFIQLREDQDTVNTGRFATFVPFFDIYASLAAKLVKGKTVDSENTFLLVPTAVYHALAAFGTVGSSSSLSTGKTCYSITTPAKYAWYVTSILSRFGRATELAGTGNYDDNGAEIDELQLGAYDDIDNVITTIYDYLRDCLDTTDTGTLAIIQESQDQCNAALRRANDAVFNGSKAILIAKSAGTYDDLLSAIAEYQDEAITALKDLAIGEYALFQPLYLQTVNSLTGLGPELFSIEYAWLVSNSNHTKATESIFDTIKGLANGTSTVDTATAQTETSTHYRLGVNVLVQSVIEVNPDATTAAASALEYFDPYSDQSSAAFYNAIALTQSGSTTSEIQEQITAMQEEGLAKISTFVDTTVDLIRNGRTWSEDVEAKITTIVEEITAYVKSYVVTCYGAIQLLNGGDLDGIDTLWSDAVSAIDGYTYQISNIRYTILRADN